jgi:peptidyl-tRNA hydrolase
MEGRDYVLSRPSKAERELLDKAIAEATEASIFWVRQGADATMTKFNKKNITKEK